MAFIQLLINRHNDDNEVYFLTLRGWYYLQIQLKFLLDMPLSAVAEEQEEE